MGSRTKHFFNKKNYVFGDLRRLAQVKVSVPQPFPSLSAEVSGSALAVYEDESLRPRWLAEAT